MNIARRYEIIDQIREGGMGEVFLGLDTFTGKIVAVKISKAENQTNIDRFLREAELLKSFEHKNIVKFLDAGQWLDTHFIVMDYVAGKQIGSDKSEIKALIGILLEVVDALSYLHKQGVIHRDIKPSNILVENNSVILVDFGIAKVQSKETLTKSGSIVGTLQYMAPEQVFGQDVDGRSDLYSIGAVMYELFTGRPPFVSQNAVELIFKILSERPADPLSINSMIPQKLRDIIVKLLEKDPDNRYQSSLELSKDLESVLDERNLSPSKIQTVSPFYAPFVGRMKETVQFEVMLDAIQTNGKQIMSVSGRPGIGKSRLIEEFRSITLSKGYKYFICDPDAADRSKPAISTVLNQLSGYKINADYALAKTFAYHIRQLSKSYADKIGLPENKKPLDYIASFPDVIAQLISKSIRETPLVVAFESNLDEFSLKVLTILSRIKSPNLGIIFVQNLDKPLTLKTNFRIELEPLTRSDLADMAWSIMNERMPQDDLEQLEMKSGGNPLFALSILRQMIATSTTITLAAMPSDIANLFERKISKLSEGSRKALFEIALIGRPMPIDKLRYFLGLSEFEMFKVSSELFKSDLITEKLYGKELCLDVVSGILTEMIYDTITYEEKDRIHNNLAQSILNSAKGVDDPTIPEAGRHFILGRHYKIGAKIILDSCSLLVDRKLFEQAKNYLDLLIPLTETLDRSQQLSFWTIYLKSINGMGRTKEAWNFVESARTILDDQNTPQIQKPQLAMICANIGVSERQYEISNAYCIKGLSFAGSGTSPELMSDLFHLLCACQWNMKNYRQALDYSEKELSYASKCSSKDKLVNALVLNGISYIGLNLDDQAKHQFTKALEVALEIDFVPGQLNAINNLIEFDFKAGRFEQVVKKLGDVRQKALSINDYSNYYSATMNLLMVLGMMGNYREASHVCEDWLRFYENTGCSISAVNLYGYITQFDLYRMDLIKLESYSRTFLDWARNQGPLEKELEALVMFAKLNFIKNESEKALNLLEKVLSNPKYAECENIFDAYSQVCIYSILSNDFEKAYVWFKDMVIALRKFSQTNDDLCKCILPKTLSFMMTGMVGSNQRLTLDIPECGIPFRDGKVDAGKMILTEKARITVPQSQINWLECYHPESVLGYAMFLNAYSQNKMLIEKNLVRDCIKLIDDTIYEMFTYDFRYLKDELTSMKSKLGSLLQG